MLCTDFKYEYTPLAEYIVCHSQKTQFLKNRVMDIALCTLDNYIYTSAQFSQLPFADIGEKRRSLICPECGGPAFFRKQTRNGRAACFGARPHQPSCSLSVLDETRVVHGQGEIAEVICNPGERIVVDLVFGAPQHVHAEPNFNPIRGGARAGIHIGDNAAHAAHASQA